MIRDIKFSSEFERGFKRLKKCYRSLPTDFNLLIDSLIENPKQGTELREGIKYASPLPQKGKVSGQEGASSYN